MNAAVAVSAWPFVFIDCLFLYVKRDAACVGQMQNRLDDVMFGWGSTCMKFVCVFVLLCACTCACSRALCACCHVTVSVVALSNSSF